MSSSEIDELKDLIGQLGTKLDIMAKSLVSCQSRCHVDNPVGKWRGLGRAIIGMFTIG